MIKAIIAHALDGAIGKENKLLWKLPRDLGYFKEQTFDQKVVMGNNTYKGLPFENGLPERINYVLTKEIFERGCKTEVFGEVYKINIDRLVNMLYFGSTRDEWDHSYWLIGGASIYEQFWDYVEEVHVTEVQSKFPDADTFYKPDLTDFEKVGDEIDVSSDELEAFVQVWRRKK